MTIHATSMGERQAGESVVEELLRHQSSTSPRSALARALGYSPLADNSVSWYRGALGEIAVGKVLATLPPEWTAFHALPIGTKGSDIDHVVIGPGGIFTVNTKNHENKAVWVGDRTLMISGQKLPYIRNAEYEAARVTKLLRQWMPLLPAAQGTIVVVRPKSVTIATKPALVEVLSDARLRRWLLKRPVVLDSAQLAELRTVIDNPATWPPQVFPSTENPMSAFAALHGEVRSAHVRSVVWRLGGIVAATVTAVLVLPPLTIAALNALFAGSAMP